MTNKFCGSDTSWFVSGNRISRLSIPRLKIQQRLDYSSQYNHFNEHLRSEKVEGRKSLCLWDTEILRSVYNKLREEEIIDETSGVEPNSNF